MSLRKSVISSIFVALMATQCAGTAQAGGGMGGGSTEITQMLNNTELITSVSHQAGINSTVLQQYLKQLEQLKLQQQNIAGLQNFNVQAELTRLGKEEARYALAKKKSDELATSSKKTSDLMSADVTAMREKGMTPSQYYGNAAQAAKDGSVYWQGAMDDSVSSMDTLAQKSKDHQDYMKKNPDIKGNVEGMQSLDRDLIRMDGTLVDMHGDFKKMLIIQQKNEVEKEDRKSMYNRNNGLRERENAVVRQEMRDYFSNKPALATPLTYDDCVKQFGLLNCKDLVGK